ncbi:MAG: ATP-binding cassette domain-containing protein [Acidimicrobiales bacterium]
MKVFKGGVRALDGLSLVVEAGTVFGLLGPNGAGKTTAVRILTTVTQPDQGRARVLGRDVQRDARWVRANIGLAGQFAAVDENLTGLENLRMIGQLTQLSRAEATSRASQLLAAFELDHVGKRPLKTYSGGMRRRLDLAAALVHRPPVLFLDEPTTGLDPYSRQELWKMVEDLVRSGTTVLLTTQYLEEADRLASRIAVVDKGRVIASGTPKELKASLGSSVAEIELLDPTEMAKVVSLVEAGLTSRAMEVDGKLEISLEGGPRELRELLVFLDDNNVVVRHLTLRDPSLDDVFLSLTGRSSGSRSSGGGQDD